MSDDEPRPDETVAGETPSDDGAPSTRRQRFKQRWRKAWGRPAATVFFGAAEVGPGRYGTAEQWAEYREQLKNPPAKQPSKPPPGYKFIWYTDGMGMRHRAAVREDRSEQTPKDEPPDKTS